MHFTRHRFPEASCSFIYYVTGSSFFFILWYSCPLRSSCFIDEKFACLVRSVGFALRVVFCRHTRLPSSYLKEEAVRSNATQQSSLWRTKYSELVDREYYASENLIKVCVLANRSVIFTVQFVLLQSEQLEGTFTDGNAISFRRKITSLK